MKLISIFAAMTWFAVAVFANEEIHWYTDWEQAKHVSSVQQKPIFIFFTGSDWSSWCTRMESEILAQPQFAKDLGKKCIFMKVDFPQAYFFAKDSFDPKLKLQIECLRDLYGVHVIPPHGLNGFGVPCVAIVNKSLQKVGHLQYVQGGPAAFDPKVETIIQGLK